MSEENKERTVIDESGPVPPEVLDTPPEPSSGNVAAASSPEGPLAPQTGVETGRVAAPVEPEKEPTDADKKHGDPEDHKLTEASPVRRHMAAAGFTVGSLFELLPENKLNNEAIQFVKDKWERSLGSITKAQQEWFAEILVNLKKKKAAADVAEKAE